MTLLIFGRTIQVSKKEKRKKKRKKIIGAIAPLSTCIRPSARAHHVASNITDDDGVPSPKEATWATKPCIRPLARARSVVSNAIDDYGVPSSEEAAWATKPCIGPLAKARHAASTTTTDDSVCVYIVVIFFSCYKTSLFFMIQPPRVCNTER